MAAQTSLRLSGRKLRKTRFVVSWLISIVKFLVWAFAVCLCDKYPFHMGWLINGVHPSLSQMVIIIEPLDILPAMRGIISSVAMLVTLLHWPLPSSCEPKNDKTNKMTSVPSEDSDQPEHPPSLISLCCLHEDTLQGWTQMFFCLGAWTAILLIFTLWEHAFSLKT